MKDGAWHGIEIVGSGIPMHLWPLPFLKEGIKNLGGVSKEALASCRWRDRCLNQGKKEPLLNVNVNVK